MGYFNTMTVPLLLINVNFEYYSSQYIQYSAQHLWDLIVFVSAIKIYSVLNIRRKYSIILSYLRVSFYFLRHFFRYINIYFFICLV